MVITELLEGNRGSLGDKDGMVPAVLRELSSSDGAEDVAVLIYQEKAVLHTGVGGRDVEVDPEPRGGSFSDGEGIIAVEEKRAGIRSLGNCVIRGIRVVIGARGVVRGAGVVTRRRGTDAGVVGDRGADQGCGIIASAVLNSIGVVGA